MKVEVKQISFVLIQRNIYGIQKDTGRNGTAFGYILDMFK